MVDPSHGRGHKRRHGPAGRGGLWPLSLRPLGRFLRLCQVRDPGLDQQPPRTRCGTGLPRRAGQDRRGVLCRRSQYRQPHLARRLPHPRGRAGHGADTAPPGSEPRLFLRFRLLDPGRGKLRLSLCRRAPRHGAQCRSQQLRPVPHAAARPQAHSALQARYRHLPVCALARGPVFRLCPDLFRQAARTVFLPGRRRWPASARAVLFEPDL